MNNVWRVAAPAGFVVLRLAIGPAMIVLSTARGGASRAWLAAMLCIGMASDFADGIAARRLGVETVTFRRFDSAADVVFWACALVCVWILSPGVVRGYGWLIAALIVLHAAATLFAWARGGGGTAVKSYLAKAMGILVFIAFLELIWRGVAGWAVWLMAVWVLAAELDVILIAAILPGYAGRVGGAWEAWVIRAAQKGAPGLNRGAGESDGNVRE